MRILRVRAKQHIKATFKDTCEQEILAQGLKLKLLQEPNEDL